MRWLAALLIALGWASISEAQVPPYPMPAPVTWRGNGTQLADGGDCVPVGTMIDGGWQDGGEFDGGVCPTDGGTGAACLNCGGLCNIWADGGWPPTSYSPLLLSDP